MYMYIYDDLVILVQKYKYRRLQRVAGGRAQGVGRGVSQTPDRSKGENVAAERHKKGAAD